MKLLIALLLVSNVAFAVEKEVWINDHIVYTTTDEPCGHLGNPDNLPLRYAFAKNMKTGKTIHGCSLDDGSVTEFQLIDEQSKVLINNRIPSQDLKVKGTM